jgi:hypothetical protein
VWINPPFKWKVLENAFLEHYLKCEDQAPTTTSACVMLPCSTALSNMRVTPQGFQSSDVIPRGSQLGQCAMVKEDAPDLDVLFTLTWWCSTILNR